MIRPPARPIHQDDRQESQTQHSKEIDPTMPSGSQGQKFLSSNRHCDAQQRTRRNGSPPVRVALQEEVEEDSAAGAECRSPHQLSHETGHTQVLQQAQHTKKHQKNADNHRIL